MPSDHPQQGQDERVHVYPDVRPLSVGLISIVAFFVAVGVGPDRASLGFYSAASQIIPLLLLVLAVEISLFRVRPTRAIHRDTSLSRAVVGMFQAGGTATGAGSTYSAALWNRLGPLLVLAALVVGELAALDPLASGTRGSGHASLVYGAIASGLTAIVLVAVLGIPTPSVDEDRIGVSKWL